MILVICWGKWVLSQTINLWRFINLGGTFQPPICSQHLEIIPWIEWKIPLLLQSHSLQNVSYKRLSWADLELDFPCLCLGPSFPKPRLCFNGNISSGSHYSGTIPCRNNRKNTWNRSICNNPLALSWWSQPSLSHPEPEPPRIPWKNQWERMKGRVKASPFSTAMKAQGIHKNIPASLFPGRLEWKWGKSQGTPKIFHPQLPWDAWNGNGSVNRGIGILDKSAHSAPGKCLDMEREPGQARAWVL